MQLCPGVVLSFCSPTCSMALPLTQSGEICNIYSHVCNWHESNSGDGAGGKEGVNAPPT